MSRTLSGFRYRLDPYSDQAKRLAATAGACRWVWNWALAYRNDAWLAAKAAGAKGVETNLGYNHLCEIIPGLRRQHPWLDAIPITALRGTLKSLDQAFDRFFAGVGGCPKFKGRGFDDGFRYTEAKGITLDGDWVKLPKFGWMRLRLHRPLKGSIRTAAVTREGKHWFISFQVEGDFALPKPKGAAIGVDLGVAQSATLSTGEAINFLAPTASEERRLRWLQRKVSRKRKGSNRRRRALGRLNKLRRRLVRRRQDAAHKLSRRLATTHRRIVIEDLQVKNMTSSARGSVARPGMMVQQKAGLNRAMLANAHADFRRMLAYKCERSGAKLVAVNPAYTSKTCSQCHHCAPENRKNQAEFRCVACGFQLNADHNAALNLLAAGSAVTARGGPGASPASEPRTRPKAGKTSLSARRKPGVCVTS